MRAHRARNCQRQRGGVMEGGRVRKIPPSGTAFRHSIPWIRLKVCLCRRSVALPLTVERERGRERDKCRHPTPATALKVRWKLWSRGFAKSAFSQSLNLQVLRSLQVANLSPCPSLLTFPPPPHTPLCLPTPRLYLSTPEPPGISSADALRTGRTM